MKKSLKVYWYKTDIGNGNFGDELNPYIITKLSGKNVDRVIIPSSGWHYIYIFYIYLKKRNLSVSNITRLIEQFFINEFIVGIGSVISIPRSKKAKIWGAGVISRKSKINKANFYAVRGRYTQKRLIELGYKAPSVIGDPALLLPLLYDPKKNKKYKIGIIPHYIHYNDIKGNVNENMIKVIDLTACIEDVINDINHCEYTISTSLHGLIVSQAYGIPSLWVSYGGSKLSGDDIKFLDYFSSVEIKEYQPYKINLSKLDINKIICFINNNKEYTRINTNLSKIQKNLIDTAPFKVLDRFNNKYK